MSEIFNNFNGELISGSITFNEENKQILCKSIIFDEQNNQILFCSKIVTPKELNLNIPIPNKKDYLLLAKMLDDNYVEGEEVLPIDINRSKKDTLLLLEQRKYAIELFGLKSD